LDRNKTCPLLYIAQCVAVNGKLLVEGNLSQFYELKCPKTVADWFVQVQVKTTTCRIF